MKATWSEAVMASLASLSLDARRALGADEVASTEQRARLRADGVWWIDPWLVSRRGNVLGLRRQPGLPAERSPVVVARGIQAKTVASAPDRAVAMRLFADGLHDRPAGWRVLRANWPQIAPELRGLHRALGGTDELDAIERIIHDDDVQRSVIYRGGDRTSVEQAAGRVLRTLDDDAAHVRYRDHLDALQRKERPAVLDYSPFGIWRGATAAASLVVMEYGVLDAAVVHAAWEVLRGPAALDTGILAPPSHVPQMADVPLADQVVHVAAVRVLDERAPIPLEWRDHPLFDASSAIARKGRSYDGAAHVTAARRLDEGNDPDRAFAALQSAAFWSRCAHGKAGDEVLAAARALVEKRGWRELSPLVDAGDEEA